MSVARKAAAEFAQKYGTGPMAYLKQGWNEIPEIIATSALALVGICMGTASLYRYMKTDGDNREYKMHYTIMRSDDPRADRVRKLIEKEQARAQK